MNHRLIIALLFSCLFFGCQKGPEDPFFSLSTRKSRISGEWTVQSLNAVSPGVVKSFDGSTMEYTIADTAMVSRTYSMQFEFERDGNYVVTHSEEFPADTITNEGAYTLETIESGIWEFTGGNDSPSKSKLVLLMQELKSIRSDQGSNVAVTSFDNPRKGLIYDIVGLSNEELILSYEETRSFAGGQALNSEKLKMQKN